MKYFKVIAKCGHIGKHNYYKGTLFLKAESAKDAARIARNVPRVKHDQKDAILDVNEIDFYAFEKGRKSNHLLHYYECKNVQEQRIYFSEIADNVFNEEKIFGEKRKNSKKHSLRKDYNFDPDYDSMQKYHNIDLSIAS